MTLLQDKQGKYPGFREERIRKADGNLTWIKPPMVEGDGWMLPDDVLDSLSCALKSHEQEINKKAQALHDAGSMPHFTKDSWKILISEPKITWEETKEIVLKAYSSFDPKLGEKVSAIFSDPSRIVLKQAEPGFAGGSCPEPNSKGIFPLERAVIYYNSDGTINDPVYLMHEIAHMLTNDFAQERGYDVDHVAMPRHVLEVPTLVAQHAVYDYLINKQPDATLKKAAEKHFVGETLLQIWDANLILSQPTTTDYTKLHKYCSATVLAAGLWTTGKIKDGRVFDALFKRGGDTNILEVLKEAGITTKESLDTFFEKSFQEIEKSFDSIASGMGVQRGLQNKSRPRPAPR